MAQTKADGSIVLSTKVDESGLKAWFASVNASAKTAQTNIKGIGISAKSASSQAKNALMGIGTALKTLMSYLIGVQAILAAIRFSGQAANFATQTEASIQRLVDIYSSASDSVGDFIDANARALGMSKAAAASFSSVYGNLFSVWADQATNAELTNRYLNMTAVVASKTGRTVEDVQERVRSGLLGNTEAIEDLGIFVNVKTIEMTDAFQRMADGKSWEQLDAYTQQQVRSMAILEQATAKYGDEVADTSATIRNRFNAAYQDFQNSWGNIVNVVLLPVLEMLTQIFDIATKGLNTLSGVSGKTLENVQIEEETTDKTAENIEQQTKNQKELNKELKKSLAGFDDIQILSAQTSENTSDSSTANLGLQALGGNLSGGSVVSEVSETMALIMGIVGFSMAALGIILLCYGQIAWGIGLLIAGIGVFTVTEAALGSGISEDVKNTLNLILSIASTAFLALGIILVLTGVGLPLGIGLIIAGAAGLVSVVAINWNAIWDAITGAFNAIINWVKTYGLLVLGILLCLSGGFPLGLALIIKWAKEGAENGVPLAETIVDKVKEAWSAVKAFWNRYIAPIFTAQWWLDLGKKSINGLIAGFEGGINGIIKAFESMINWIVDGLNKISFDIPDWLGGGSFGINLPRASFGRVSIPRLAQGAVIPPNREFLAVLGDQKQGTNIETPLATMVEAFNIALNNRGNDTVKEEHYYLDESEIMRIIYKLAKKGEQAQGDDLLEGW